MKMHWKKNVAGCVSTFVCFCVLTLRSRVVTLPRSQTVNSGQIAAFSIHWFLLMPLFLSHPSLSATKSSGEWHQGLWLRTSLWHLRWWSWAPRSLRLSNMTCLWVKPKILDSWGTPPNPHISLLSAFFPPWIMALSFLSLYLCVFLPFFFSLFVASSCSRFLCPCTGVELETTGLKTHCLSFALFHHQHWHSPHLPTGFVTLLCGDVHFYIQHYNCA